MPSKRILTRITLLIAAIVCIYGIYIFKKKPWTADYLIGEAYAEMNKFEQDNADFLNEATIRSEDYVVYTDCEKIEFYRSYNLPQADFGQTCLAIKNYFENRSDYTLRVDHCDSKKPSILENKSRFFRAYQNNKVKRQITKKQDKVNEYRGYSLELFEAESTEPIILTVNFYLRNENTFEINPNTGETNCYFYKYKKVKSLNVIHQKP